ncbi:hypothetical protein [Proteiniclasticum ruminis]|mgnify:CR=1 FL=1|uniref:Immunity protein 17 n=1 Tax=Proteiniclasticum ruminis TaxID=398199 RepID=A0A1G8PMC4_9CLOT|nr:hypothetical protein [Proteiniclasticum ruminis]SDI93448.1 hypothetical protein SAMN05421804_105145 [Proteiniclasticum ruminis]
MDGLALIGLILLVYAGAVVYITLKKPEAIWNMAKIRVFRKLLGDRGTEIFFYLFALASAGFGLWLLVN